jgi:upstream activation factor subunit UAF30
MDIGADKLRREIQIILKDADLNTLSSKKVRQMLEALFKCDFTERKKEIDDILMSEITTRDTTQTNNDEQDDNDDDAQIQTSDDEKPAPSHTKKNKKQQRRTNHNNNNNNQQTTSIAKSDEELAMEIHQQENRPSLRHSRPIKSTSSLSSKKTGTIKVERRKTSYNKELDLSDQLASVVGGNQMPRSEVVKRMWAYFKEHNLLDPHNKQFVNCDETLAKLFGRKRIRAFGMLKDLTKHMSDPDKQ